MKAQNGRLGCISERSESPQTRRIETPDYMGGCLVRSLGVEIAAAIDQNELIIVASAVCASYAWTIIAHGLARASAGEITSTSSC